MGRSAAIGLAVLVLGFLMFIAGTPAAAITGVVHPVLVALLGFALLIVGGLAFVWDEEPVRRADGRPTPLVCPSCGGTPRTLPASGRVTCDYCGTWFVV